MQKRRRWKGLIITLAEHIDTNPGAAGAARRVIDEVLADHKARHGSTNEF
jgi:hypothetical protein